MEKTPLTFLFADLAGFTALTETHGDEDAADVVARFYDLTRASLIGESRLMKTIGDAVMIVADQPQAAVLTALRLVAAVRAGLHSGSAAELSRQDCRFETACITFVLLLARKSSRKILNLISKDKVGSINMRRR